MPMVHDLEAGALHHHADQVLADVVDVTLDGADDHLAHRLGACLRQQRPQDSHAALHGVRGEQHLGHEQDPVAKVDADDGHAAHQGVVQDLVRRPAPLEQDLRAFDDLVPEAVVQIVVHLLDQFLVVEFGKDEIVLLLSVHVFAVDIVAHGNRLKPSNILKRRVAVTSRRLASARMAGPTAIQGPCSGVDYLPAFFLRWGYGSIPR